MKKLGILVMALMMIGAVQANVVLTEHFGQATETLATNDNIFAGEIASSGWTNINGSGQIYMGSADLTYADYKSTTDGTGSAEYKATFGKKVATPISPISSGSVYVAAIMNITAYGASSTPARDYEWALCTGTSSISTAGNHYARLCMQKTASGFQLGIAKQAESAAFLAYTDELSFGKYLVVMEYQFVSGDKNDIVYLYLNPTKGDKPAATLECRQSYINPNTGSDVGSGTKDDAAQFAAFMLYSSGTTKAAMQIDELKITTDWMDLWEDGGGSTDPSISVTKTAIDFSNVYTGEPEAESFTIKGENLTEGVTISHTNSEIALSASSLTKDAAEAGASLTLTLTPNIEGVGKDTVVLTSSGVTKKIPVVWYTWSVIDCANIAGLKSHLSATDDPEDWIGLRLTGEAIVTRDTIINSKHELYIQDASGALYIDDSYDIWVGKVRVGDKISNFRGSAASPSFGVKHLLAETVPTVVSQGNEVIPQVVTLAQLQANAQDYLLEVVRVEGVVFAAAGGTFSGNDGGNYAISQDTQNATVKVEMGNGLSGKTIPALANVNGFSLNTSGSVIVPRNGKDVEDATPKPLLKNASFEDYEVRSFLGVPATEFDDWTGLNSAGLTAEKTDVLDGETALKTTVDYKTTGTLYQSINMEDYNAGDEFKLRICYKVLTDQGAGTLTLNSYWASARTSQMSDDAAILYGVALPNSAVWDTLEVVTHKPTDATKFEFRLTVLKNAIVLLDNFAFEYVEPTQYFSVTPTSVKSVTTDINTNIAVGTFTVKQKGLTQPVVIEITGTGAAMFSADKTQVTTDGEQVVVTYHPTAVGNHDAYITFVDDENHTTTLCNTAVGLHGTAIDPTQKPTISVTPMTLPHHTIAAQTWVYDTLTLTSTNCIDDVFCHVTHLTGSAFQLLDYSLPKNTTRAVVLQFYPKEAGECSSKLWWTTQGGDTVAIVVTGTATAPAPPVVDYDTVFHWDSSAPLDILDEHFGNAATYHNKTYRVPTGWQNVVTQGTRAWWGYDTDTTNMAKACGYAYGIETCTAMETWLVTPALNFNTAGKKQFGFRVMGQLLSEDQVGHLQLWYLDPANNVEQQISAVDALIPAMDSEKSGKWVDVVVDLTGQDIADAFFMAFRYADYSCNTGVIYNITDVTWGIELVPTGLQEGMKTGEAAPQTKKVMIDGVMYIWRGGAIYNLNGVRVE